MIGTPDDAIEYIQGLLDQSGGFGTFLMLGHDWADPERTLNCYRLFAREVIPHFQGQLEAPRASHDWATAKRGELFGRAGQAIMNAIQTHVRGEARPKRPTGVTNGTDNADRRSRCHEGRRPSTRGRSSSATTSPSRRPASGQVLVEVKACGICGSDLHFAKHGATCSASATQMEGMPEIGRRHELDLDRDVYMGHEFAAEVLDVGPGTEAVPAGHDRDVDPHPHDAWRASQPIVYSNTTDGGYGERMLLSAPLLLEVPNGLDPRHAALTEPMAVGLHAVNRARPPAGRRRARARVRARSVSPSSPP